MSISNFKKLAAASLLVASFAAAPAFAGPIACGSEYRTATLDSAESCKIGSGNPHESDIETQFGGDWNHLGGVDKDGDTSSFLNLTLNSGSFGDEPITATWTIDPSFWSLYGSAVLSIHVGNGSYDPDYFAWVITPGETSGTLSYDKLMGNGGGFSNMHLWASGKPTEVPEPATLALLGLGLVGAGIARRRRK